MQDEKVRALPQPPLSNRRVPRSPSHNAAEGWVNYFASAAHVLWRTAVMCIGRNGWELNLRDGSLLAIAGIIIGGLRPSGWRVRPVCRLYRREIRLLAGTPATRAAMISLSKYPVKVTPTSVDLTHWDEHGHPLAAP